MKQHSNFHFNSAVRHAAVEALARGYKDDPDTLSIVKDRAHNDQNYDVRCAAVKALARGYKDNPDTLSWLKDRAHNDEDNDVRHAAMQELARGYKADPDALSILKDRAQNDEYYVVRHSAVQELARGWRQQPELFGLLSQITVNDPYQREYEWESNPRQTALEAILDYFPQHPQTLELLRDRAAHDPDTELRDWATKRLTAWGKSIQNFKL